MTEAMLLQRVELHSDPERSPLFHRGHRGHEVVELTATDEGVLPVPRGVRASFDTYFGAFPERSWLGNTVLGTFDLEVTCRGSGMLRVCRETPQRDQYQLHAGPISGDSSVRVHLRRDDPFRAEAGRVWFEMEADDDLVVLDARWTTTDRPPAHVRANVVFCTFNRLPYLRRILSEMGAHPEFTDAVARVTVVNQGDPFTLDAFPEFVASPLAERLVLIHQNNLGGCGGFSRGMWETLRNPDLTHVILLDDDIELHAESLSRATAFLAFTDGSIALGGQMLDLFFPTRLYEAGAELDAGDLLPRPILHDLELSSLHAGPDLMQRPDPDYNGWWFFALSSDRIREVGLPLPCFIRGDDIEYGIRLRQASVQTITMPGVAVWHEPFYAKLGGWHQFFENRNLLAMASLRNVGSWWSLRRHLLRSFAGNLLRSRYHSASFTVMAMEDFLSGADACIETTDAALRRCLAVTAEIGPVIVERADAIDDPSQRRPDRSASTGGGVLSRIVAVVRLPKRAALLVHRLRNDPTPDAVVPDRPANGPVWELAALDAYSVVLGLGRVARLTRNPRVERQLWIRFIRAWVRLRPNRELAQREAAGLRPWQEYWDDMFTGPRADRG